MTTRAPSFFLKTFIVFGLFAPFFIFAHASEAATTTNAVITITSPLDEASTTVGETVNIDFDATNLTTAFANITLNQNGTPVAEIATVNILANQSGYSLPWTVPAVTSGTYTITVADGQTGTAGAESSVSLIINTDDLAGPTPLINIDPSQVVFDASTGTYNYTNAAQEASFEAQVAALGASSNNSNQLNTAVGIVGDALVNSAGQCVGTALAKQVGSALSNLGGSALVAPTAIPVNNTPITAKEIATAPGAPSLDSIGYCIGNAMLQTLSDSVTKWINNDFQLPDGSTGSSYLKDPDQFFKNLADVTAGQFLGNFTVNGVNLCSNFSLPLRLNLLQQYSTSYNQTALCTLGTIVKNLSAFTGGDFSQGGWDGWFAMTQNSNNNYYGSYINAANQLQIKLDTAKTGVQLDLTNGNGFLSYKKCTSYAPNTIVNGHTVQGKCTTYETETPGKLVADAATQNISDPRERLIVSNSFDQVVTALITSMVSRLSNFAQSSGSGIGL